jgi:uncharacterized protein YegP (UPF0339 family)
MKIVITRNGLFKQKWSFKIVSKNGKTLAHSEKYNNRVDMVSAIDLIQQGAAGCEIENKYLN